MKKPEERYTWEAWIEVFQIFQRYGALVMDISAEHDVIYAGPDPAKVSEEDKDRLDTLGWNSSEEYACFYRFV